MKKTLALVAAIVFACQLSNAQTNKGTQNLGLNLGYIHTTNTISGAGSIYKLSASSFNIGPNFGYFISDGLEIGAGFRFNASSQNNSNENPQGYIATDKQTSNVYGGSVYFRKYVLYDKKIGFRAGPYAGYNYGTSKHSPNTYLANPKEVKGATNDYNAGANLDLVYYPSPKVGIAATLVNLAYSHNKSTDNSSPNTSEVENFAFNFTIVV
jgi:hypothetical protein